MFVRRALKAEAQVILYCTLDFLSIRLVFGMNFVLKPAARDIMT